MTAINFTMFVDKVANGTKTQTIRATTRARAGEPLQLYVGQRTKDCRKVKDVICKSVTDVILMQHLVVIKGDAARTGIYLEEFAQHDGFATYADMWAFFGRRADEKGEFHGKLIKW